MLISPLKPVLTTLSLGLYSESWPLSRPLVYTDLWQIKKPAECQPCPRCSRNKPFSRLLQGSSRYGITIISPPQRHTYILSHTQFSSPWLFSGSGSDRPPLPHASSLSSTDPQQEAGPVFLTNLFLITCPSGGQICRAPPAVLAVISKLSVGSPERACKRLGENSGLGAGTMKGGLFVQSLQTV